MGRRVKGGHSIKEDLVVIAEQRSESIDLNDTVIVYACMV